MYNTYSITDYIRVASIMSHTIAQIAQTHSDITFSYGRLSEREKEFVRSVYQQSLRACFAGLSPKQESWFVAIERKLEAQRNTLRAKSLNRTRAYYAACW